MHDIISTILRKDTCINHHPYKRSHRRPLKNKSEEVRRLQVIIIFYVDNEFLGNAPILKGWLCGILLDPGHICDMGWRLSSETYIFQSWLIFSKIFSLKYNLIIGSASNEYYSQSLSKPNNPDRTDDKTYNMWSIHQQTIFLCHSKWCQCPSGLKRHILWKVTSRRRLCSFLSNGE